MMDMPDQDPTTWKHAGAMPPEQEAMKEAAYNLAPWLSAALDDPKVCQEYKDAINGWFDTAMPVPPAHQCNWPICQSEEYQHALADLIKQDLVTGDASPQRNYVYVVALNFAEFQQYTTNNPLVNGKYVFVSNEAQLQGLIDPAVLILPGAHSKPGNVSSLVEYAMTRCGRKKYE